MPHDTVTIGMLGLLLLAFVWLAAELRRLRETIEPLATSRLAGLVASI